MIGFMTATENRTCMKIAFRLCPLAALALALLGQTPRLKSVPKIYIEPQNGFESYISAAFFKKHVPGTIASDKQGATLVLRSGAPAIQEEKSGLGKLARCAYALCIGIDGSLTVSVELIDAATSQIVWAYSVRKIGAVNYQSSAEAIAKHLKGFLEQKPPKKNGSKP
jgi:hypothetical protein